MTPADGGAAGVARFEVLYNEGSDSVVIADVQTHDDIAEVFHCERHTVAQTVEQALETARMFANADRMLSALRQLLVVAGTTITDRQQAIFDNARKVIADVEGIPS